MTAPRMKIFVAVSNFAENGKEPLALLEQSGLPFSVNLTGKRLTRDQLLQQAEGAQGIIAGLEPYDAEVLEKLPALRCISRCGVGLDNIDLEKARGKGIAVLNTPDAVIQPVAELAVAMMLDLVKKLTLQTSVLRTGQWKKSVGHLLTARRVGILGLGRIGKRTAEMLRAWGGEVWGTDLAPDQIWAQEKGVKIVGTEELLRSCDIISIHLNIVAGKPYCLTEKEIRMMKPGSMLVNVSRGIFVDEPSVCAALKSGHLAGAAFDAFSQEPYQGPLRDFDQVVLTPHVATFTEESRREMEWQATRNLLTFLNSENSSNR